MRFLDKAFDYVKSVKSGELPSGKYAKLAVDRFLNDLQKSQDDNSDFPYKFDEQKAEKALKFIHLIRHTKGTQATNREFIDWQPFQCFIVANLFGFIHKDTGYRRFTSAYIKMARKNGKTTLAAAIFNYLLLISPKGSEFYYAATKREQARIGFDIAKQQLIELKRDSKYIDGLYNFNAHTIFSETENKKVKVLGKESKSEDGLNPTAALVDELHAHPNSDLYDVIDTGMGSQSEPLLLAITTAGFNSDGYCFNYEATCKHMLAGVFTNDRLFVLTYDIDEEDDWQNPEVWIKANPSLGVTPTHEFMEQQFLKATTEGSSKAAQFKTKNLNMWLSSDEGFLDAKSWKQSGQHTFDEKELLGRPCYMGVDIASTRDFTAAVLVFPFEDGSLKVLTRFYYPEMNVPDGQISMKIPLKEWITDGYVIATEGNVFDLEYLTRDIIALNELYDIREISYDKWNATQMAIKLEEQGINLKPHPQTTTFFNGSVREFELLVASEKLHHNNSPVLSWMANNSVVFADSSGNRKVKKGVSKGAKVDGMVALLMAMTSFLNFTSEDNTIYNTDDRAEGLLFI